jgi:predicted nucleic acid-binding protein
MSLTLDTRFFLTHFLADTEDLRRRTSKKMAELRRAMAFVPTIVLHEVYKFQFENLGADVAELRLDTILKSGFTLVDLDPRIAVISAQLRCRHKELPTADAIVAATAIATKSGRIVSDDLHFREIKTIKTEWI